MKPMPDINKFCLACHVASEAKGWTNLKRTDAQTINLMISELSEALEDFRDKRGVNEIYYEVKGQTNVYTREETNRYPAPSGHYKPCGIPIELADFVIRVGQQCGTYELHLGTAMDNEKSYGF